MISTICVVRSCMQTVYNLGQPSATMNCACQYEQIISEKAGPLLAATWTHAYHLVLLCCYRLTPIPLKLPLVVLTDIPTPATLLPWIL